MARTRRHRGPSWVRERTKVGERERERVEGRKLLP